MAEDARRDVVVSGSYVSGHVGTAAVSVPFAPRARLELGGEGSDSFVIGNAGVRLDSGRIALGDDGEDGPELVGDLAIGAGVGRGGQRCGNASTTDTDGSCEADGRAWHERFAYGAYLGGGGALHLSEGFAVFGRAGIRLSAASGVPGTFWVNGLLGIDLRFGPVAVHGGIGLFGYANDMDDQGGAYLETGLSLLL